MFCPWWELGGVLASSQADLPASVICKELVVRRKTKLRQWGVGEGIIVSLISTFHGLLLTLLDRPDLPLSLLNGIQANLTLLLLLCYWYAMYQKDHGCGIRFILTSAIYATVESHPASSLLLEPQQKISPSPEQIADYGTCRHGSRYWQQR